jgi:nicotinate-nucleotide adenylyltransferase
VRRLRPGTVGRPATMAELGILGGTFNPPHIGHLVMAQEVLAQLEVDRVAFVPVNTPPHKQLLDDPGPDVRLELCRRAIAGDARLEVSTIELERGGASYTVDTLRGLHEREPEHALTFIVGGDMAHSLPTWREPEEILRLARLAVAEREEWRREDIARRLEPLHSGDRVKFFDMPRLDVSSSTIRARVAAGRPIRYLVPDSIAAAIESMDLYRPPAGGPAA